MEYVKGWPSAKLAWWRIQVVDGHNKERSGKSIKITQLSKEANESISKLTTLRPILVRSSQEMNIIELDKREKALNNRSFTRLLPTKSFTNFIDWLLVSPDSINVHEIKEKGSNSNSNTHEYRIGTEMSKEKKLNRVEMQPNLGSDSSSHSDPDPDSNTNFSSNETFRDFLGSSSKSSESLSFGSRSKPTTNFNNNNNNNNRKLNEDSELELVWMRKELEIQLADSTWSYFSPSSLTKQLELISSSVSYHQTPMPSAPELSLLNNDNRSVRYEDRTRNKKQHFQPPLVLLVCGANNLGPNNKLIMDWLANSSSIDSNGARVGPGAGAGPTDQNHLYSRNHESSSNKLGPIFRPIQLQVLGKFSFF